MIVTVYERLSESIRVVYQDSPTVGFENLNIWTASQTNRAAIQSQKNDDQIAQAKRQKKDSETDDP